MLTDADLRLMVALSQHPAASLASLGRAVGTSGAAAAARLRDLVSREVLFPDFVKAQISYSRVGLEPVACLMSSDPGQWSGVEHALDRHPYTRYRIRCMGAISGHFVLFAVPYGTLHLLASFLEGLSGLLGDGSDFQMFPLVAEPLYRETDFSLLRPDMTWGFDWQSWLASALIGHEPLVAKRPSLLHLLDRRDMRILRELSINLRRKKKEIAKAVKMPAYTLSKRLHLFREKAVVVGPRVTFNRSMVGLLANVLFLCRCSVSATERAVNAASLLPFQSALYPIEGGFILHLDQVPPQNFPQIAAFAEKCATKAVSTWCDYTSSCRYYFDNEPTNYGSTGWRSDREFMRDDVLSAVRA